MCNPGKRYLFHQVSPFDFLRQFHSPSCCLIGLFRLHLFSIVPFLHRISPGSLATGQRQFSFKRLTVSSRADPQSCKITITRRQGPDPCFSAPSNDLASRMPLDISTNPNPFLVYPCTCPLKSLWFRLSRKPQTPLSTLLRSHQTIDCLRRYLFLPSPKNWK